MKLRIMAATLLAATFLSANLGMAQETEEEILKYNSQTYAKEGIIKKRIDFSKSGTKPSTAVVATPKNTMMEPVSADLKMGIMQGMLSVTPFSLRQMINIMVAKKKVVPGVSFDDVIESIKTKANELNMTATGHNTPYKILREIDNPKSPRLEILGFCDLKTMRKIVDYSMEFIAFLPCRMSVLEDAKGDIWIVTLDWDIRWMDNSPNPNRISDELREAAIKVRSNIEEIMEAAATGDF